MLKKVNEGFPFVLSCNILSFFAPELLDEIIIVPFGLVLIVEGLPYLAFPDKMKKWLQQIQQVPDNQLRIIGFLAMCFGLLLTYIFK